MGAVLSTNLTGHIIRSKSRLAEIDVVLFEDMDRSLVEVLLISERGLLR